MIIQFEKMSGAGNDFVVFDNRGYGLRAKSRLARMLCDRRNGIGADGILLLEESTRADFRMEYYNADGSYGGMCGNGGRCIATFAASRGIRANPMTFEALDHVYKAKLLRGNRVTLWMKNPSRLVVGLKLKTGATAVFGDFIDTGSPHFVVLGRSPSSRWREIENINVAQMGRALRLHPRFQPEGTNVNFARVQEGGRVELRTYERGVEAETLACGTGSIAAVLVLARRKSLKSPVSVLTRSGFTLRVAFKKRAKAFEDIRLTGPVETTFRGTIQIPA